MISSMTTMLPLTAKKSLTFATINKISLWALHSFWSLWLPPWTSVKIQHCSRLSTYTFSSWIISSMTCCLSHSQQLINFSTSHFPLICNLVFPQYTLISILSYLPRPLCSQGIPNFASFQRSCLFCTYLSYVLCHVKCHLRI